MHRFFIFDPDKIADGHAVIVSEELIHQFCDVLRFKNGEQIMFLDNSGYEYLCEIGDMSKKEISARIIEKRRNKAEPSVRICLYQAIPKNPEKFEFVLQKGTEVGVCEFVPLITNRTERESLHKLPRLEKILKESAEQSGRGIIPKLCEPIKFKNALKQSVQRLVQQASQQSPNKKVVNHLAHIEADKLLNDVIKDLPRDIEQINIYVGPEGGFTEREIASARGAGAIIFSIGPRVLRSETAGIVIPALILAGLEMF